MIKYEKSLVELVEECINRPSIQSFSANNQISLQSVHIGDDNPMEMVVLAIARPKVTKEEAELKEYKINDDEMDAMGRLTLKGIADIFQAKFFEHPFMDYERDYINKLYEQLGVNSEMFREAYRDFMRPRRSEEYWVGIDKGMKDI